MTYNKPLRVESVEIDEALKPWQAIEPANGMHCSVAMAVWELVEEVEEQIVGRRDCQHFKGQVPRVRMYPGALVLDEWAIRYYTKGVK
jgi:hypothetical protein